MTMTQKGYKRAYKSFAGEYLAGRNAEVGTAFEPIAKHEWTATDPAPIAAWRNNTFLVQAFAAPNDVIRLSVNKTSVKGFTKKLHPIWSDGITWEELQAIKSELGYGQMWAVECYPPDDQVVNVANMRHLWLLPKPPNFGWH